MIKKRILALGMAVLFTGILSGCSSSGDTAGSTTTESTVTTAATEGTTASEPAESGTEETSAETVTEAGQAETNSGGIGDNTLVVYFSATGNTGTVGGYIADLLGADVYEIVPEEPYTSAQLNWNDSSSRVSTEHEDPEFRPEIAGELPDLSAYDTVFIGYPIWWGEAPNIVWTFMENAGLSDKIVVPFCTSSSSGLGSSAQTLQEFAPDNNWLAGQRFRSSVSEEDVVTWVNGLELNN